MGGKEQNVLTESAPSAGVVSSKPMTMEEKLARWRMKKRANRISSRRDIKTGKPVSGSKKKDAGAKSRRRLSLADISQKKENIHLNSNSDFDYNPELLNTKNVQTSRRKSRRRHSMLPQRRLKLNTEGKLSSKSILKESSSSPDWEEVQSRKLEELDITSTSPKEMCQTDEKNATNSENRKCSFVSPTKDNNEEVHKEVYISAMNKSDSPEPSRTLGSPNLANNSSKNVEQSVLLSLEETTIEPTAESMTKKSKDDTDSPSDGFSDMKEEVECLKYANDVLVQQLSQLTKEKQNYIQKVKLLELQNSRFLVQEKKHSNDIELIKKTLTAGLETAVLELEKVRQTLREKELENEHLKKQLGANLEECVSSPVNESANIDILS